MAEYSKWRIASLVHLVDGDKTVLLEQLQAWGLIPRQGEYLCPKCSAPLNLYVHAQSAAGWRWFCTNKVSVRKQKRRTCGTEVSLYKGTFLERSHITREQILIFVHLWLWDFPLRFICNELCLASHTAVAWSSFCRQVLFDEFINHPEKLGGPGITVEIDESKFGKQNGLQGVEEQWVFGGFERVTGRVFMVSVEDRTAETLVPLIKRWIKPGTTIISNCRSADFCLIEHGYNHVTFNNSLHFCDPDTGAHINHIKSSWRAVKAIMLSGGCTKASIPGNLARYMFYKRCKQLGEDKFEAFLKLAGKQYNPLNPRQPHDDRDITEDEISQEESLVRDFCYYS